MFHSYLNDEYHELAIIVVAGVRAIFGPCRYYAGLVPRPQDGTECLELAPRARTLHAEACDRGGAAPACACKFVKACAWNGNKNLERVASFGPCLNLR